MLNTEFKVLGRKIHYELTIKMCIKHLERIHKDDWTLDRISNALHSAFYECVENWNVEYLFNELTIIRNEKINTRK